MRPDLWCRAEELFHAAVEQSPDTRQAFLDRACGHDTELRRYVNRLVSADDSAGSFLDRSGVADPLAAIGAAGSLAGREFGHYRVETPLGVGGMGEVYRAHDRKLGRDVAIKTLPSQFARDRGRVSRLRREARTLASLNHPHIAAIYGLEEFDGTDFLVLELVEGQHPAGPLPVPEALRIGEQVAEALAAVLEGEPDWRLLPAKTPARVRRLLRDCLQKDVNLRLAAIDDARKTIEQVRGGVSRRRIALAGAGALVLVLAAAIALWREPPVQATDSSQWVQLTKFPDSVAQPALSPDGRMAAFVRGESTFFGPGQIYVKALPDGEPVQLTNDALEKMSPAFSPDGSRIAYTTVNPDFQWDTWTVPVRGGEPQLMLENASGLVWSGPRRIMFSEMRTGVHMAVVTSEESRGALRDVYVPADEPAMAHRSYPSPDGKWVLLVEMDIDHLWEPCRLVPADGSSAGRKVGPREGGCTFAAWSRDGQWMYFTSNAVSANHIWRQRFPDGKPEQITGGPTAEEGIAMAPDGRSFVTAVSIQGASLWLHDSSGDRQISLEGNAGNPAFTPDGRKLLYRVVREQPNEFAFFRDPGEVMVADLTFGHVEPLVPGFRVLNFDVSRDGRQVVMEAPDGAGRGRLWLAALDRSGAPRQVPNVEGSHPHFGRDGEILFRHTEGVTAGGRLGFIYRVRPDGSGLRKAIEHPVHQFNFSSPVSPDGKWVYAWGPLGGDGPVTGQVYSLEGKPSIPLGGLGQIAWATGGALLSIIGSPRAFFVPLPPDEMVPPGLAGRFHSDDEIAHLPGARRIDGRLVTLGPSPDFSAFYRGNTQRNLYRVPIP